MQNLNNPIANQNSELPACSEVPHPTAPPCARSSWIKSINYEELKLGNVSNLRWIVTILLRPFATSGASHLRPQYSIQKTRTFNSAALRISELLVFSREWVRAVSGADGL